MDESELDDTPETAPVSYKVQRHVDAKTARDRRDGPVFKKLRDTFRADCSRQRNVDGSVGAPCHLCGTDIDYRLIYPHPNSWSLDHIKTVKERPDLVEDPFNFAAAHLDCNLRRSTDDMPLLLGQPSEEW